NRPSVCSPAALSVTRLPKNQWASPPPRSRAYGRACVVGIGSPLSDILAIYSTYLESSQMQGEVNPRRYKSAMRREQAAATRTRIVRAAAELFAAQGYTQTSIEQIAARAGVARPTVYTAFTGKPALLKEALDLQLAGDDAPVPVKDRPWFQELL